MVVCEGCNKFAIPYEAHIDGYFSAPIAQRGNQRKCTVNNDNQAIEIFKNAERFEKTSTGQLILSKGGNKILTLAPKADTAQVTLQLPSYLSSSTRNT